MLELILSAIVLLVIIAAFAYLMLKKKQQDSSGLFKKKRAIDEELKIIEANFFRRKIPEAEYRKIIQEKQLELIKIESTISIAVDKPKLTDVEKQILAKVEIKQRHIVQELFGEKKLLLKERDLIMQRYHKRKIDEALFKEMMNKNQKEIISIESRIRSTAKEAEIEKTMSDLKEKTMEFRKEKEAEEEEAIDALLDQAMEYDEDKK